MKASKVFWAFSVFFSSLVCLTNANEDRNSPVNCEVGDAIYRDGVVSPGWGVLVAEGLWILKDPLTGLVGGLVIESWKAEYLEGFPGDAWHAGIYWRYEVDDTVLYRADENDTGVEKSMSGERFWVIHSDGASGTEDNPFRTRQSGPNYALFDAGGTGGSGTFLGGNEFRGARSFRNITTEQRQDVLYHGFLQVVNAAEFSYPEVVALDFYEFVYNYKDAGNEFRCDGLVEYCYEQAGADIMPNESGLTLTPYSQSKSANFIASNLDTPPVIENKVHGTNPDSDILLQFSERMSVQSFGDGGAIFSLLVNGNAKNFSFFLNHSSTEYQSLTVKTTVVLEATGGFNYTDHVQLFVDETKVRDMAGNRLGGRSNFSVLDFYIQDAPTTPPTSITLTASTSDTNIEPYDTITISGTAKYNNGSNVTNGTVTINTGTSTYTTPVNNGIYSRVVIGPSSTRDVNVSVSDGTLSASRNIRINVGSDIDNSSYDLQTAVVWHVDGNNSSVDWQYKDAFRTTDPHVELVAAVENANLSTDLDFEWRFYKPDGSQYVTTIYADSAIDRNWSFGWATRGFLIKDALMEELPGKYKIKFYINDERVATHYFVIGWDFTQQFLCEDRDPNWNPVNRKNVFSPDDPQVMALHHFEYQAQEIETRTEFWGPDGNKVSSGEWTIDADGLGPHEWYPTRRHESTLSIAGTSRQFMCGDWAVKFFIKNPGTGVWEEQYSEPFRIEENVPPTVTVDHTPSNPEEGEYVNLQINVSDNNHLEKIDLRWQNGTADITETWDNINSSTRNITAPMPRLGAGATLTYWVEAWDESGNRTESVRKSFTVSEMVVSVPSRPSGPAAIQPNQNRTFTVSGSATSQGGNVEYQFDWGDGTTSDWGDGTATKSWASEGTYFITATARSADRTYRVSNPSPILSLSVDGTPPIIDCLNGEDVIEVYEEVFVFHGSTDDASPSSGMAGISIEPNIANEGTLSDWQYTLALQAGINTFIVTARDNAGNTSTRSAAIIYKEKFTVLLQPGAQGIINEADGTGNFTVAIVDGEDFPAVTVLANEGFVHTGWLPELPETVTSDFEGVAQYSKLHEVTFDLGSYGLFADEADLTQTVADGGSAVAPDFITVTGWVFDGWDADISDVRSDLLVSARYLKRRQSVDFDFGEHGRYLSGDLSQLVDYGTAAIEPDFNVDPGWVFSGWDPVLTSWVTSDMHVVAQYEIDSDGDGLADSWENLHFGSLQRDGSGDFDSDGISDLTEFRKGTHPRRVDGGRVFAWGYNGDGAIDVPATAKLGVVGIWGSAFNSYALKADGSIVAWGSNTFGQLDVPERIQGNTIALASKNAHILALTEKGEVVSWALAGWSNSPVPNAAQSGVVAIANGNDHSVALRADGEVVEWAGNFYFNDHRIVPDEARIDVVAVSASQLHTAALKADGTILNWEYDNHGKARVVCGPNDDVVSIAAGDYGYVLALTHNNEVLLWDGESNAVILPEQAEGNIIDADLNGIHAIVLKDDGSVFSWIVTTGAETPRPTELGTDIQRVAAARDHTLALKNIYTVRFNPGQHGSIHETILGESVYASAFTLGEAISPPSVVENEGWVFAGWQPDLPAFVEGDLDVTAQYELQTFSVQFSAGQNGHIVSGEPNQIISYKESATAPQISADELWTHVGWDNTFSEVTSDLVITARYEFAADPIQITLQPSDSVVNYQNQAEFRVEAANATSYQWYFLGVPLNNSDEISGADSATLVIAQVNPGHEGDYFCIVSNPNEQEISDSAKLEMNFNQVLEEHSVTYNYSLPITSSRSPCKIKAGVFAGEDREPYIESIHFSGSDKVLSIDGGHFLGDIVGSGYRHKIYIFGGVFEGRIEFWAHDIEIHIFGMDLAFQDEKITGVLSDGNPIDVDVSGSNISVILFEMAPEQVPEPVITLHPGEHGSILEANSGEDFVAELERGSYFPNVTVHPDSGYRHNGWSRPLPNTVMGHWESTAKYYRLLSGAGTEVDPYRIESREDFDLFCKSEFYWGDGIHTRLDVDIDLIGISYNAAPIAPNVQVDQYSYEYNGTPYSGCFNGNGHTISNLLIEGPEYQWSGFLGLFGYVSGTASKIDGLSLEGLQISVYEGESIGGLCGYSRGATISNCSTSVSIVCNEYGTAIGGLCGSNSGGKIVNSSSMGNVTTGSYSSHVGGLCGTSKYEYFGQWLASEISFSHSSVSLTSEDNCSYLGGLSGENYNLVINCFATGNVHTGDNARNLGGLCGLNRSSSRYHATISNSYATGNVSTGNQSEKLGGLTGENNQSTIEDSYAIGNVSATISSSELGGICGYNYRGVIRSSYAKGSITSGNNSSSVGGLCGSNEIRYGGSWTQVMILNNYATGDVATGSSSSYVGGFIGKSEAPVANCLFVGTILFRDDSTHTGGFCGLNTSTITGSFWDSDVAGYSLSDGGTGLTTYQLMSSPTFIEAGWDFTQEIENGTDDVWSMDGYPVLFWQLPVYYTLTLHPGDHGQINEANAGSDYVVEILKGSSLPSVTVAPDIGYRFAGWSIELPGTITQDFDSTALYWINSTDGYNAWILSNSMGSDINRVDPAMDFDNDGRTNFFEYIFTSDPKDSTDSPITYQNFKQKDKQSYQQLTFSVRLDHEAIYRGYVSTNLDFWSPSVLSHANGVWISSNESLLTIESAIENPDGTWTLTIENKNPVVPGHSRFMKLEVVSPY